jgi:hypothetical protein
MAKRNLLPVMTSLLLSIGLLASDQALAFQFNLKTKLPPKEKAAVSDLLHKAEALLPPKMKIALGDVNVTVEDLSSFRDNKAAGMASRGGLILSQRYIPDVVAGPGSSRQTPKRQHKNAYDETLATVLHETTHLYDFLNLHSPEESKWIMRCRKPSEFDKGQRLYSLPKECPVYENMNLTFSQNPYFLQVAGWMGLDFNGYKHRSPDDYELATPQEYFAVNMEFFLMDPEYKCRRPSMYRMLAGHFQFEPYAGVTCESKLGYVMPGNASENEPAKLLEIDPSRVYQVHYLLADKGEATMSGWGHAMIRLVICAPERKEVGPACLGDTSNSVVLSYRAFVDSLNISSLDGLRGKYPSRLFILPLRQVIEEYNKTELRALKSIPLRMSRKEIENFVVRSVEAHWAYDGKYYFISNNCATETMNLLKGSLLRQDLSFTDVKTPLDLMDSLVRLKLADNSVLNDLNKALTLGFYFDSYEQRYNVAYGYLKGPLGIPAKDFKEYVEYTAAQRAIYINRITKGNVNWPQQAAYSLIIEDASMRKMKAKIMSKIQAIIVAEMNDAKEKGVSTGKAGEMAQQYLRISQLFAMPAFFLADEGGYGLPSSAEVVHAQAKITAQGKEAMEVEKQANDIGESLITPADMREIEQIKANAAAAKAFFPKKNLSMSAKAPVEK